MILWQINSDAYASKESDYNLTDDMKFKSTSIAEYTFMVSAEVVFRRALTLANCRQDVTLETVLSHPAGPIPTSMYHEKMCEN